MTGVALHSRSRLVTSRPSMSGQPEVEQDEIRRVRGRLLERLATGVDLEDAIAVRRQREAHERAHLRLVFDDEDQRLGFGHPASFSIASITPLARRRGGLLERQREPERGAAAASLLDPDAAAVRARRCRGRS